MRSKLFVPGSRPELFAKALASEADAISVDLEDAVASEQKELARRLVSEFLQTAATISSNKIIIARCNDVYSNYFELDIEAILLPRLDILNLPKIESAADIQHAVIKIEKLEKEMHLAKPIQILANIETAKGMINAAEIAASNTRVIGLQLGLNDLFGSMNINRNDTKNLHATMYSLRLAAGSAGVLAYDGAFADINNEDGFKKEAEIAYGLGYVGKSCIHPKQIPLANKIFTTTKEAIELAKRIIEAAIQAEKNGQGAFKLDGKMIDKPAIEQAKLILNNHR